MNRLLSDLLFSFNVVAPIVLLVLFGMFLKKIGMVDENFTATADKIVFKIALPIMLFLEVAKSGFSNSLNLRLIVFCLISVTSVFLLTSLIAPLFIRDRTKCGAFVQGACRSNFAILGVPLAENLFGESGTGVIAIVTPFVILMFNTYSVILLSVFSEKRENRLNRKALGNIFKNVVTNPLIIAVILGVPFMLWGIELPSVADKTLTHLKNLATPLALISLGANFKMESMKGRIGLAVGSSILKTAILPTLMVTLAVFLGFRDEALGVILILFGAPTAVSSYIMAKNMDNDHELAAQILLLTTVLFGFTIFIGVFILKSLNLI